jgi:beta-glucosidase
MAKDFPDNFIFGVAASAYQIEGGNKNCDWYLWEQEKNLERCGVACDFWNRYREDIDIMSSLGIHAHRVGIEWSRVEPEKNKIDYEAVERYREILKAHKDKGIKVFLNLHHFTLPIWVYKNGSVFNEENQREFEEHCAFIAREFKGLVDTYCTINEPGAWAIESFLAGEFPPGLKSIKWYKKAYRAIMEMHARAYRAVKSEDPNKPAGVVHACACVLPRHRFEPADWILAWIFRRNSNEVVVNGLLDGKIFGKKIEGLEESSDYLGLNYYTKALVCASMFWKPREGGMVSSARKGEKVNQMGWSVYPEGILKVIEEVSRAGKPIIITENGIATEDDNWRIEYTRLHLEKIKEALGQGYDIRGYFHWSYIDNFEWAKGYVPKLGIVGLERGSLKRVPRGSAYFYEKVCRERVISTEFEKV